jgi:two-component system, LytTR family, sensor kinase
MSQSKFLNRRWALIIFSAWTLYGLLFGLQAYISSSLVGRPLPLWIALGTPLSCSYAWALLTPGVIALTHRFPMEPKRYLRSIPTHLTAALLFSPIQLAIYVLVQKHILGTQYDTPTVWDAYKNIWVFEFSANLIRYGLVVVITQTYFNYQRYRERQTRAAQLELEASQMETELARAQLSALKAQLHPHFLFNTLNSISVLMHENVTAAEQTLIRLSDLLRLTLATADTNEVPVAQEMEFLRRYVEIEQTRFQDRLQVHTQVAPEALEAQVPSLILQPLVENAIHHGISTQAEGGRIDVRVMRRDDLVELLISDDGPGIGEDAPKTSNGGVGLANTRARLQKLYGGRHTFTLSQAPQGGLQVTITIPFHTDSEDGNHSA